jgi:hypothetical protein
VAGLIAAAVIAGLAQLVLHAGRNLDTSLKTADKPSPIRPGR